MGGSRQTAADMDFDAWAQTFAVNTMAPLRLALALKPALMRAARPRAITISSQMGALSRRTKGSYAYRSTKAAVNKTMQLLAEEWRSNGICVAVIHPGWVRTDMGGSVAQIEPSESADGLFTVARDLTLADTGRFLQWTGEAHPW